MKKSGPSFRALRNGWFILLAAGIVSGCATTGEMPASQPKPVYGIEKKQTSPTADMTGLEKAGYYLGQVALDSLYIFASANPQFSP
jgi:hypothetical protein